MANITFTLTTQPSTTCPSIPANLQLNVTASIPYGIFVSTLGTNTSERRKVQNRLNQRARRERQAVERPNNVQVFDVHPQTSVNQRNADRSIQEDSGHESDTVQGPADRQIFPLNPDAFTVSPGQLYPSFVALPDHCIPGFRALAPDVSWCKPLESLMTENHIADIQNPENILVVQGESAITSFEKSFLNNLNPSDLNRLPGDDHLLSLMYYNVFRALVSNARLLSLDTYAMHADDYPLPFATGSAYNYPIPPHLQPT